MVPGMVERGYAAARLEDSADAGRIVRASREAVPRLPRQRVGAIADPSRRGNRNVGEAQTPVRLPPIGADRSKLAGVSWRERTEWRHAAGSASWLSPDSPVSHIEIMSYIRIAHPCEVSVRTVERRVDGALRLRRQQRMPVDMEVP